MLLQIETLEDLAPVEPRERRFEKRFLLDCSIQEAWSYFSNTNWFNQAIGLSVVHYSTHRNADGELIVEGAMPFLGSKMRWREHPFQWLRPRVSIVQRDFIGGPILRLRGGFDLMQGADGRCTVRIFTALLPRNEVGSLMIRAIIGPSAMAQVDRAFHKLKKVMSTDRSLAGQMPPITVSPTTTSALTSGLDRLHSIGGFEPSEISNLAELIRSVDDVETSRLRPFVIASRWGIPKWDAVRLFLHATRAGLLDLSWHVLCPSCGEDSNPKQSLRQLREQMHCDSCEIGFGAEFDRSVELRFSIHGAVRPVKEGTFCLGGANFRQSLISQIICPPAETTILDWPLEAGRYRFKSDLWERGVDASVSSLAPLAPGTLRLKWEGGAGPEIDPEGFAGERLEIANRTVLPLTLRVEKLAEADEVLTAREVTNWQEFRDLFSSEVLSPGEQLLVGRQVLLFTDLKGSTELYQDIGDAQAYSRVREHFKILVEVLREHRGALVKTIGDAVMAVFSSVGDGLASAVTMHRALAMFESERNPDDPLKLKVALHAGPCLMISANGILDCFGTTVNYAARLLGESGADLVAISDEVRESDEGRAFFEDSGIIPEKSMRRLRGFAAEQPVWVFHASESSG